MYKIIKAVINTRDFELENILEKINAFWVHGKLTDDQHTELLALAREKAIPENSYVGQQKRIDALYERIADLEKRVAMLETPEDDDTGLDNAEEYPEYVAPTGAHDAYYAGDKLTYKGVRYVCVAPDGVAVVWNPDVMPSYWQENESLS